MSFGHGNINLVNNPLPLGPPYDPTSAYNGLSVDGTGRIVLGGDVGQLTDGNLVTDRLITLDNHYISLNDVSGEIRLRDAQINLAKTMQPGVAINLDVTNNSVITLFNDDPAFGSAILFTNGIGNPGNAIADETLLNGTFHIGGAAGSNLTRIAITDATGEIKLSNTGNTAFVNINGVAGFTGTVAAPASITVDGGIVTAVS